MAKTFFTANNIRLFPGFAYGLRSPSIQISVKLNKDFSFERTPLILKKLSSISPEIIADIDISKDHLEIYEFFESLLKILNNIFGIAKVPVYEKDFLILDSNINNHKQLTLIVPTFFYGHKYTLFVINSLFEIVNKLMIDSDDQAVIESIRNICKKPMFLQIFGSNLTHFVAAARDQAVQVLLVADRVFQFGQGKNARWMESSFTDKTSNLGSKIARNKMIAAQVLKNSGLPVPDHILVKNKDEAIKAGHKLGYPVVVKPLDLDGGIGVAADIRSENELALAFSESSKHAKKILVERHIEGKDYRLNIFNGKLLWAIERIYPGVVGDGIHSIHFLIDQTNTDIRRGIDNQSSLKKILVDDEMLDFLASREMTLDYIPRENQFVQLRRRANIASGGFPVSVMDKVHKDNTALAIRAAKSLKLDLAGVDLIMPDISKSWMEVGGAICEVNAQPQLGSVTSKHCYAEIIKELIPGTGRIPIVIVIGDAHSFCKKVSAYIESKGIRVGLYLDGQLFVSNKLISNQVKNCYSAGSILIRDKEIDAIVLHLNDLSILKSGLPFDRFDSILVFGECDTMIDKSRMNDLMSMLLPACDGDAYLDNTLIDGIFSSNNAVNIFSEKATAMNSDKFVAKFSTNLVCKYFDLNF